MADDPKLVTALEVRLNAFEKQLKEAGVIAEREVKNIEDKFAKANPVFGGTFLGTFLGPMRTHLRGGARGPMSCKARVQV